MIAFGWFQLWLILHILSVIIAFGPTFAFGLMGSYAKRHPQHALAVAEVTHLIAQRIVVPVMVLVPFFGTALIFTGKFDLWKSEWLIIAIILFTIAFFVAILIQLPNSTRLVEALSKLPPGPPPEGAQPPADVAAITKKLSIGGAFLGLMIVVIVILMVWRPGACIVGTSC